MMHFSQLERYNYILPLELIRKTPLEPRDSARLFVYDTEKDSVSFDVFRNLATYLPERSLLVVNNTKVFPARLFLRKETGGKIEALVLVNEMKTEERIPLVVDRKTEVGKKLFFPNGDFLEISEQKENIFMAKLRSKISLFSLLDTFGSTPIPHYLESEGERSENLLRKRYQTVFAKSGASVAAPTASLHFTPAVFENIQRKGIEKTEVTLNVGLGTFASITDENFRTGKLHTEYVELTQKTADILNTARKKQKKIISVGTTVTRTLEGLVGSDGFREFQGPLDTFLFPPYRFQVADILLTNFHLPNTSLILLVDAFLQSKGAKRGVMDLYKIAIEEKFSFYSFGDSMLIL